jgi:hypothetical protein
MASRRRRRPPAGSRPRGVSDAAAPRAGIGLALGLAGNLLLTSIPGGVGEFARVAGLAYENWLL